MKARIIELVAEIELLQQQNLKIDVLEVRKIKILLSSLKLFELNYDLTLLPSHYTAYFRALCHLHNIVFVFIVIWLRPDYPDF